MQAPELIDPEPPPGMRIRGKKADTVSFHRDDETVQAGVGARQGFDLVERDEEGQAGVEVGTLAAKAALLRVEGMDGRSGRGRISKQGVDMRGKVREDRTSK